MQYHILTGDALREQLADSLAGEVIVARECLVDGPISSGSLELLYRLRAQFVTSCYDGYTEQDYHDTAVAEFSKIQSIAKGSVVYLWFEDDLFCQVNFWFVCQLLHVYTGVADVRLVMPSEHSQYGFGRHTKEGLLELLDQNKPVKHVDLIANLWTLYANGDTQALLDNATALSTHYPFLLPAVKAHIARIPNGSYRGRPVESLQLIVEEVGSDDFGEVFRLFCQRESIYGYGDVQVRRLFDGLVSSDHV